jgi:outer membrane protein assembly factor BamB
VRLWTSATLLAMALAVTGCNREFILEGERFPLRAPFSEDAGEPPASRAEAIRLPGTHVNAAWTTRLGTPNTRISHPALNATPSQQWAASIGQGDGRRHRITAEPVAANGIIYTLDSRALVSATNTAGATVWTRDLTPSATRSPDGASGGGLALSDGRLYVTSAFGSLTVLDAASGQTVWTKTFDAPVTAPPTIAGDRVYVVAADSTAWSLETRDGKTDWVLPGTPSTASMVGGAAPAVAGELVLFPTPAGELIAARRDTGMIEWRTSIAGTRLGVAYAAIKDITGDPVIDGGRVFIGNQSGRVMALDLADGRKLWTADEAAYGPVWPVGGSVFLMSDRNRLVRLDAETGEFIWGQPLSLHTEQRERRRAEIYAHFGPLLAGGQLIIASSDGMLRGFDPANGALRMQTELPSGAASAPIAVGGALYVVSRNGSLLAYR